MVLRFIILVLLVLILVFNPYSARLATLAVAKVYSLDEGVFYRQIAAESSFRTWVKSSAGAIGLGQVQESTAKYIMPFYYKGLLWVPLYNLHASAGYHQYLLRKYKNNLSLALAAYNWGETNVNRRLKQNNITISSAKNYRYLFADIKETYGYLGKIMRQGKRD